MSDIAVKIIKSKRKTLAIYISPLGEVTVRGPLSCSDRLINTFLKEKDDWIREKLKAIENRKETLQMRSFKNGEILRLLGKDYPLIVEESKTEKIETSFDNKCFKVRLKMLEKDAILYRELMKKALISLYKKIALKILTERTVYYGDLIQVKYEKITVKDQKTLWGSCSSKNNINYNWKIIMAPIDIVDYLVVHELCHIKQRNHSEKYWAEVAKYMKNYKEKELWLKQFGNRLNIEYTET